MKDAVFIHHMKDGSILTTEEELEEYGRTHELPALTQELMLRIMSGECRKKSG